MVKALRIFLVVFLSLFCLAVIALSFVYLHHLLQGSSTAVKITVWTLAGTGLYILSSLLFHWRGKTSVRKDYSERISELKQYIGELQIHIQSLESALQQRSEKCRVLEQKLIALGARPPEEALSHAPIGSSKTAAAESRPHEAPSESGKIKHFFGWKKNRKS